MLLQNKYLDILNLFISCYIFSKYLFKQFLELFGSGIIELTYISFKMNGGCGWFCVKGFKN